MELSPREKFVKSKRRIKEEKKSNYDKKFHPLRMMKTSTPTTKNNSKKDDSGSRSSKSNSTNKIPTRKPSIKSCPVTPNVDKVKIVQVPNAFDRNDKDDMLTVSSSSHSNLFVPK